jgi:hypothetical protein
VKFKVQLVIETESGDTQLIEEVAQIEKGNLQPENLGLTLAQAKDCLTVLVPSNQPAPSIQ